jgi:hypothetical protein
VGVPGLEPGTFSLSEKRSSQLSYTPGIKFSISNFQSIFNDKISKLFEN